jgi:adenylate kinase
MKHKVINFIGAPGCGKSCIGSYVFAELKIMHKSVEYIQEYAKKLIYENRLDELNNQYNITNMQYKTIKAINNVVEYCVTDSPLLLGLYYNRVYPDNICNIEKVEKIILEKIYEFENIYIFLERNTDYPFEKNGRVHNEEQSDVIAIELEKLLCEFNIPYKKCISNKTCIPDILDYILQF